MLAERSGDEDALCAICAEGHSQEPDLIVFCERCDLGVHQRCYGIEPLPPGGSWLHTRDGRAIELAL